MSLTLDETHAISARVRERATELGATVTVAIVDGGGHVLVVDRMDEASPLSARVAPAKASSAALFHQDGADLLRLQQAHPAVVAQIIDVAGAPIVVGGAARLIRRDGVVIGAIAIAGGTLAQDEACADVGAGTSVSPRS